jgi:hypothetical protein
VSPGLWTGYLSLVTLQLWKGQYAPSCLANWWQPGPAKPEGCWQGELWGRAQLSPLASGRVTHRWLPWAKAIQLGCCANVRRGWMLFLTYLRIAAFFFTMSSISDSLERVSVRGCSWYSDLLREFWVLGWIWGWWPRDWVAVLICLGEVFYFFFQIFYCDNIHIT